MSVPDRVEAIRLLLSLQPPPWHLRHSRAVAETAAWLAARIAVQGIPVDRRLVESAALLHDVDKLLPRDDPASVLPHGDAGAAWLTRNGYGELSRALAGHPVGRLADGEGYRRWSAFATREERIVAYADKRCGQQLGPMSARFASWDRRYPWIAGVSGSARADGPPVGAHQAWDPRTRLRVRERAERLEADICRAANVRPEDVRRLAWTGPAIRAAKR